MSRCLLRNVPRPVYTAIAACFTCAALLPAALYAGCWALYNQQCYDCIEVPTGLIACEDLGSDMRCWDWLCLYSGECVCDVVINYYNRTRMQVISATQGREDYELVGYKICALVQGCVGCDNAGRCQAGGPPQEWTCAEYALLGNQCGPSS